MIDSCAIWNFRGIRQGELTGLAPLTVLTGPNNSGKSTSLEAMSIAWAQEPTKALDAAIRIRGWMGIAGLDYLVSSPGARILLQGNCGTEQHPLQSEVRPKRQPTMSQEVVNAAVQAGLRGQVSGFEVQCRLRVGNVDGRLHSHYVAYDEGGSVFAFLHEDPGITVPPRPYAFLDARVPAVRLIDSLSLVQKAGEEAHTRLIGYLRQVDDGIKEIRALPLGGTWAPHVYYAKSGIPLYLNGDGIIRLFSIGGNIAPLSRGVVFLEEPECYQHIKSMEQLTRILWDAIDAGNQVIASTHSLELIDMLCLEAANRNKGLDRTALFRLALKDGELKSVHVPGPDVTMLRHDLAEDLRR